MTTTTTPEMFGALLAENACGGAEWDVYQSGDPDSASVHYYLVTMAEDYRRQAMDHDEGTPAYLAYQAKADAYRDAVRVVQNASLHYVRTRNRRMTEVREQLARELAS